MRIHIKLLTLLLALMMLLQASAVTIFAFEPIDIDTDIYGASSSQPSKYSSQYNSGERDVVATTLNGTSADAYYNGSNEYDVLSTKGQTEIKNALKTLMTNTHTYISSYNDCHYKADRTDCENEDGSVSLIYTSYSATMSQWNGWNREHVWPQSKGGGNTSGGGADMHHIRPSDASVNSARGNKSYGNVNGGTAKYGSNPASGVLGGHYDSTYFEPLDNVKGDIARIVLYVWVRWGTAWGAESVTEVFQSVDVLLEWCCLDPVDTWELGRNEVIQSIQGNRNVFIDYPEYAWLVFGREVPSNMTTPSGEAKNGGGTSTPGHSWDNGTITVQPTCTVNGTKVYKCTDSGCTETKTVTIEALGHSYIGGKCINCGLKDPSVNYTAADFMAIVMELDAGIYSEEEKYLKICEAVNIYTSLSDTDKASVQSDYDLLFKVVDEYNKTVNSANSDADTLRDSLLGAVVTSLSLASFALYSLLNKKYF